MSDWKPIETYDLGPRIPILVCDPKWHDSRTPTANVAQAYWCDFENRWMVCLFEGCSTYAWVTYKEFTPKFWMECPKAP